MAAKQVANVELDDSAQCLFWGESASWTDLSEGPQSPATRPLPKRECCAMHERQETESCTAAVKDGIKVGCGPFPAGRINPLDANAATDLMAAESPL